MQQGAGKERENVSKKDQKANKLDGEKKEEGQKIRHITSARYLRFSVTIQPTIISIYSRILRSFV